MADNGEGGDENRSSNIAELRKQVLSLVTRRFEGTIEKPISDVVSRVLCKRRKKWRKRHDLPSEVTSRPPDPALRDEKERLTDQYYQSGEQLLVCRRNSYALARQLERDKRKLQLQVPESHHQSTTRQPLESEPPAVITHENSSILKDLQTALSQADALAKVKQMKLTMTPRLPPLHRRECLEGDTPDEQFGMSLLVPPQQVMQCTVPEEDVIVDVDPNSTHPVLSKLLTSGVDTYISEGGKEDMLVQTSKGDLDVAADQGPSTNDTSEHMELDPAVELSPVSREQEINFHDERGSHSPEGLPRIACVMSLMEGQDTASVVEVMAENDIVIETHSSMDSEKGQAETNHLDNSFDERFISDDILPLLPEKEEIVSTTPDNIEAAADTQATCTTSADTNHVTTSPESLKDSNHLTAEEELVEMIMKDSELAAWIAKARLRPRNPISYSETTKKRRSRSRSSSVHD